jgi:predicted phosphodiesterase
LQGANHTVHATRLPRLTAATARKGGSLREVRTRCESCNVQRHMRRVVGVLLVMFATACQRDAQPAAGSTANEAETREVRPLPNPTPPAGGLAMPNHLGSVKFAVIGDSGRGDQPQYQIAAQMVAFRAKFAYSFVIMNGDNIYEGPASAIDYREKFEKPYQPLLAEGVKFYAVLGNHDDPQQVNYAPFNMEGHRYYTFRPPEDPVTSLLTSVRFFAIDTVTLDRQQMQWLQQQLSESESRWKICFFHHPMYTSGRYRAASAAFRWALEPLFRQYGVDVVFSGHEHFYMRSQLQNGIQYFVSGAAGSLRYGDSTPTPLVARAFDTDYHFMLVEIERDVLSFQAISRTGETVDSGALYRHDVPSTAATQPTSSRDTVVLPRFAAPVP